MEKKCCGSRKQVLAIGLCLLALVGSLALAGGAMSGVPANSNVSKTAWYSDVNAAPNTASSTASSTAGNVQTNAAINYAKAMSEAFHAAAEQALPSVVMITNTPPVAERTSGRGAPSGKNSEEAPFDFRGTPFGDLFRNNPELRDFFREMPNMPEMPRGSMAAGSGVIVDPSGVILTNNHVVEGGGKVMVRLTDGREFKAVDIKTDPKTDLAILRIEGAGTLTAAQLGNSDKLEIGDWVLALGEPFGLEGTVTAGIISAKGRGLGIADREDFIQTDAPINPGNSGGPLVNLNGEVIGINTAISSRNGTYEGIGFAIPVNLAKWVGGQLVEKGVVHRAFLGIGIQPITQDLAKQLNVKLHQGVLVSDVQPNTPAAQAGLKSGDIVLQFADKNITNPRELQLLVERTPIGSKQPLVILRDGKESTVQMTLSEMPANLTASRKSLRGGATVKPQSASFDKLGIEAETLTPQVANQLGIKTEEGVVITGVQRGTPADVAGLSEGMVIREVNRQTIKTVDDLKKALDAASLDQGLLLRLQTSDGSRYVAIRGES
jgi:serine protease Do